MIRADLHQFCAGELDPRYYLRLPWSRGEWSYATNGHIIVRVPRLTDVDENPKAPDAEKLFNGSKVMEWLPVPTCDMPPDNDCEYCHGTGIYAERGEDDIDCEWCDHTGKIQNLDGLTVGDASFAKRYLALIQGWEIAPDGQNPAWIRNGEATGLLMPRRM